MSFGFFAGGAASSRSVLTRDGLRAFFALRCEPEGCGGMVGGWRMRRAVRAGGTTLAVTVCRVTPRLTRYVARDRGHSLEDAFRARLSGASIEGQRRATRLEAVL